MFHRNTTMKLADILNKIVIFHSGKPEYYIQGVGCPVNSLSLCFLKINGLVAWELLCTVACMKEDNILDLF